MRSDRTLRRWYRVINRKFFEGACPERVCVRWANTNEEHEMRWEPRYFGWANGIDDDPYHDYVIVMSRPLNKKAVIRLSTLAHEMIHLATALRDDHGPAFERWRQHISDRGLFKKHALYKGLILF